MKGIITIAFILFLIYIVTTVVIDRSKEWSGFIMITGCIIAACNGLISDDIIFTLICVAHAVTSISGFGFGADKSFAAIGIYNLEILGCGYSLSREVDEAGEVIKNGNGVIQVITVALMVIVGIYYFNEDLRYVDVSGSIKNLLKKLFE
jgi:hypothetical protein